MWKRLETILIAVMSSFSRWTLPTKGVDLYVDGTDGSDTASGKSWGTALKTISAAIAAVEAYRGTDTHFRNRIFVAGGLYAALTALPNYCDIIGCGAEPWGDGTNIVRIGADGASGVVGDAGGNRGLGFYNIQFISGGAFSCAQFTSLFRSRFEKCAFKSSGHAVTYGLRFTGACGGVSIIGCHWMADSDTIHANGISIEGDHFNACRVIDNFITGSSAGVVIAAGCKNGDYSWFKDNCIGDGGKGTCAIGIDDNSTTGFVGGAIFSGNAIVATIPIQITTKGLGRGPGNYTGDGFTTVA